jgi:hypothetical protein
VSLPGSKYLFYTLFYLENYIFANLFKGKNLAIVREKNDENDNKRS